MCVPAETQEEIEGMSCKQLMAALEGASDCYASALRCELMFRMGEENLDCKHRQK